MADTYYITKLDLFRHGPEMEMLSLLQMLSKRCDGVKNVRRVIQRDYRGKMKDTILYMRGFPLDNAMEVVSAAAKRVPNTSERLPVYEKVLSALKKEFEDAESASA